MGQLFKPTFVDQHRVTIASDKGEARGHDDKDLVALSLVSHHHAACQAHGVNAGRQRLRGRKAAGQLQAWSFRCSRPPLPWEAALRPGLEQN